MFLSFWPYRPGLFFYALDRMFHNKRCHRLGSWWS